jgi:hypothetical protein
MKVALVVLLAITTNAVAQPPPPERVDTGHGRKLATAGGLLLLTSWGLSFSAAAAGSLDRDDRWLYAPVIGPWITLAERADCQPARDTCDDPGEDALLAVDGVVQLGSAVMIVTGLLEWRREDQRTLAVTPTVSRGAPGLTVAGTF